MNHYIENSPRVFHSLKEAITQRQQEAVERGGFVRVYAGTRKVTIDRTAKRRDA